MPATDAHDAFLSYARADDPAFVERLHKDLVKRGFRIWWDRVDMPNRALTFLQEIRDSIDSADRLIAVVGPAALASDHVRAEWEHARLFGKGVVAIPRLSSYEEMPPDLARFHGPDFRQDAQYEAALDELAGLLRTALAPLGSLSGVPALSAHYVSRPAELERLQDLVLADVRAPLALAPNERVFSLIGMSGAGKSVLAAAFARTAEVRRVFHRDGVIWASVGRQARLLEVARTIGAALGVEVEDDVAIAFATLQRSLDDRSCLIVLDDVWDVADVERVIGAIGDHVRLLLTTRKESVAAAVGAQHLDLDRHPLSEALARRMLEAYSGQAAAPWPAAASEVLHECGKLPFAIALSGSMAREGLPWADLRDALRDADLGFIEQALPGYEYTDLLRAQQVGVVDLASDKADCVERYFDLVVFPDDVAVPEAAVMTLWSAAGLSGRSARKALAILDQRSLLEVSGSYPARRLSMHDLQHDFLRASVPDARARHRRLVDAYRRRCDGRWAAAPDDAYFFQHYARHVFFANGSGELERLLFDFDWLLARIERCGIVALLEDFALESDERSRLRYLEDVLRRSAMALESDRAQLAGQLLGHIGRLRMGELLDRLLDQARAWRARPWLRPLQGSLVPPGNALRATLAGHEGTPRSVAISADGQWGASAGNSQPDQTLRVWDLDKGVLAHILLDQAPQGQSTPLVFAAQGSILVCGFGPLINAWHTRTGRRLFALDRHQAAVTALAIEERGERLLSASTDGALVLWDLASRGGECGELLAQTDSPPLALALSPNGQHAAARTEAAIELWDLPTRRHRRRALPVADTLAGSASPCLVVADDGGWVCFGIPLQAWQPETDALAVAMDPGQGAQVLALAARQAAVVLVTPDSQMLLIVDRAASGSRVRADLPGQLAAISCAVITPDGKRALVGLGDHRLKVWDLGIVPALGRTLGGEPARRALRRIDPCDDGRYAVILRDNGDEELLDLASGEFLRDLDAREQLLAAARALRAADAALVNEIVRRLEPESPGEDPPPAELGEFNTVLLSARPRWSVKAVRGSFALAAPVVDAKYGEYPEPEQVPEGSSGFPLQLLDRCAEGGVIRFLAGHSLPVLAVAISDDGTLAISGGDGRTLRVWELPSGRPRYILTGHQGSIHAVALSRTGTIAASASEDRTLRVWDLASGQHLASFTGELRMTACALAPDGRTLIAGEGDGRVHVLRLELP